MLRSVSAFMILLAFSPARADEPDFDRAVKPLLAKHCTACHGSEKTKGEIRLDGAAPDFVNAKTRAVWEKVHSMLVRGEMPPREKVKLTADELDVLTTWIRRGIERGVLADRGGAGRTTMRRLTRVEYVRMLEDVLGVKYANVPLKLADKLPNDPQSEAPINDGDLLTFQSLHLKSYIDLAERTVSSVLASGPRPTPFTYRVDPRSLLPDTLYGIQNQKGLGGTIGAKEKDDKSKLASVHIGAYERTEAGGVPLPPIYRMDGYLGRDKSNTGSWYIQIPYMAPTGVLHLRIRAGAVIPPGEGAPILRVALHNNVINQIYGKEIASFPVMNPAEKLQDYEVEIPLDLIDFPYVLFERSKFISLRITNDYAPIGDRVKPAATKGKGDDWPWKEPQLVIDHIEVTGPGTTAWPPRRHLALVAAGDKLTDDRERATAIISDIAAKAWRRQVTAAEIAPFVKHYEQRRQAGDSRDGALFQPIVSVLVSPFATYIVERKAVAVAPLTEIELANRLSIFLWGSGPDRELLELATAGKLHDPKVLAAQVERLLDHPRSRVFAEDFVGRWLALDRIENDPIDFGLTLRTFSNLKVAQLRETALKRDLATEPVRFFEHMLRQNRPVTDLLGSDYVMANDRLANYYGIADVTGIDFRTVAAPADRKGGILTMAGVLAAASRGNKESTIHRGVYLLGRVLGEHPGTPPGNVEPLDVQAKSDAKRRQLSIREQVKMHTAINTCQLCHRKIDPLGFVWADFDFVGQKIIAKNANPATPAAAIDCSGKLPDGRAFTGLADFAAKLGDENAKSRYQFEEVLVRHLASYALGRQLNLQDDALISDLTKSGRRDGWRLRALIVSIVLSQSFTHG